MVKQSFPLAFYQSYFNTISFQCQKTHLSRHRRNDQWFNIDLPKFFERKPDLLVNRLLYEYVITSFDSLAINKLWASFTSDFNTPFSDSEICYLFLLFLKIEMRIIYSVFPPDFCINKVYSFMFIFSSGSSTRNFRFVTHV